MSILQTISGRGAPEQVEKYPGLKPYLGGWTSGELASKISQHPLFAPNTELGKKYSAALGEGGQKLDKFMRDVSGYIPEKLDWVPGEYPELANIMNQATYLGLSVVNPVKGLRGATSIVKGGMYPAAMTPKLMRADYWGEGLDIPWYSGGAGRAFQQTKMVGEFFGSKVANFLRPRSAYLSETKGISNTAFKELRTLEGRLDQFKDKSKTTIYQPTGKTHKYMYNMAVREYVDQWANIIGQAKIYRPDHPLLKNLERDLVGNIFPSAKRAKIADVDANPQIIGEQLLNSKLPDGVINHMMSDLKVKLRTGKEDIQFVRKTLEPFSYGKNVRSIAQKPNLKVRDGIHYQQNSFSSIIGTPTNNFTDGILQILKEDGISITKNNIINKAIELNKNYTGTKSSWKHDIPLLEKSVQRGDGYISFGNTSLSPDRLLATMHHRWVFDASTGQAIMFNFDHLRFGSGLKLMDKLVNIGAKNRFVVIEPYKAQMIEGILGKKANISNEWNLRSSTEFMPKPPKGSTRVDVVREAGRKILEDEPPPEFIAARTAETAVSPPAIVTGLEDENR